MHTVLLYNKTLFVITADHKVGKQCQSREVAIKCYFEICEKLDSQGVLSENSTILN